jgi:predicted oxidoreductase
MHVRALFSVSRTRRQLLGLDAMKGPVYLAVLVCACLALRGPAAAAEAPQVDIVVVGTGISGLCAALEGARHGATVTVIDMSSVFGGHAVMSSGMVCMIGTPEQSASHVVDSAKLAFKDFVRFGEDTNPGWARLYAKNSKREVYDWLHDLGVSQWELYPQIIPGNSVRRQHVAKGRGVGLVSPIYRECLRYPNLSFVWNTKVAALIVESNRVVGVRGVHQRSGRTNEFRSAFVVLATGGFESNLEMVRAFWPRYFPGLTSDTRILLGSGINALGSGLELAGSARAALARLDHQLFYCTGLVDPRDPTSGRGTHAFNRAAIWVNAQGKRFVWDGAPDPKTQMPVVLRQTPPTYWAIFDAGSRPQFFVSGSDWDDTNVVQQQIFANPKLARWVKQADTVEALAQAAGLPPATLAHSIRRWNGMISQGADVDFHRFDTSSEERPVKIAVPPFYAVQFFPLARKSLGGVAIDLSCRVLDSQERPIPGLHAVGELSGVGGINGKAALEGTMLGPSILMGRVAAEDIVARLPHRLKPLPGNFARTASASVTTISTNGTQPSALAGGNATDLENLRAWREVLGQLVAKSRPGYLHFEKAHALVLARNYDCARCHHETSPLALTEDQLDRRALIQSCAICHGGVKE